MAKIKNTRSPQETMHLMNIAEQVFDEAKYDLAIQYYTEVIPLINSSANLAYALYMRGCAFKALGFLNNAHKDWEKAKNLGFNHPWGVNVIDEALDSL